MVIQDILEAQRLNSYSCRFDLSVHDVLQRLYRLNGCLRFGSFKVHGLRYSVFTWHNWCKTLWDKATPAVVTSFFCVRARQGNKIKDKDSIKRTYITF